MRMRTPTSHTSSASGRQVRGAPRAGLPAALTAAPRRAPDEVARQLERYPRGHRLSLQVLASEHQPYEDLLFSCPALAVSLAARRGPPAERGEALHLIRRGAPLIDALAAVELPLWLRKLPPEAFGFAPPHPFPQPELDRAALGGGYDPRSDAEFGRRAVSLRPSAEWTGWLRWLLAARQAGGDEFALWIMSHRLGWSRCGPERGLGPLAAYAWCSNAPEQNAYDLLPREWSPSLTLSAAVRAVRRWLLHLSFDISGPAPESPWGRSRRIRGYMFEALRGIDAFVDEGLSMKNCLASYAEAAAEGRCRIYALKRGGRSVANLEIRPGGEPEAPPVIHQLLGRRNRRASAAAREAVMMWRDEIMAELADSPRLSRRERDAFAPPDLDQWRAIFAPFLKTRPEAAPFLAPSLDDPRRALDAMSRMCRLSRAGARERPF